MSLCVQCAQPTFRPGELCVYHISGPTDDWATGNRLMCDFLHRGVVPATLPGFADPLIELLDATLEVALAA
jgi:hypothetical protein